MVNTNKGNISRDSYDYYIDTIPKYEYSDWEPEENEFIIPSFTIEDEAIEFMIKYKIEGFVAPTIERIK